jgi:Na+/H+ antiporter NhaD/arsenite permease-like protein
MALLFVNVSIGGTLTHFAAPPVLMVADAWNWNTMFMLQNFGVRAFVSIMISTIVCTMVFRRVLLRLAHNPIHSQEHMFQKQLFGRVPAWVVVSNLIFLALCVYYHRNIAFILPLFLLFIGWYEVTQEYQKQLKLRESLMVGLFLGGVVTLGTLQQWWLSPILESLTKGEMYLGAMGLTAFTDNAAVTFLGTLAPNLTDTMKYVLVAGAVVGGGLTVIANAPNPIGHGILSESFGDKGISPLIFFIWALPFTIIAAMCFWLGA